MSHQTNKRMAVIPATMYMGREATLCRTFLLKCSIVTPSALRVLENPSPCVPGCGTSLRIDAQGRALKCLYLARSHVIDLVAW